MVRKSRHILTKQDLADIQQPLSKDGYSNDYFDKLYGKDKNPYISTERDRKNKGRRSVQSFSWPSGLWEKIFQKKSSSKKHSTAPA